MYAGQSELTVTYRFASEIYTATCPLTNSWTWGDETEIGDAQWWFGLQRTVLLSTTASERKAWVGKTKKMTLSTAVLGTTVVSMRCIGADQDGENTLTF
jgi:hypothetical protein